VRKRRTDDTQIWDDNLPEDLKAAVKFLHHSFGETHWKISSLTERFCYAMLHGETVQDLHEWAPPFNQLKVIVGGAATKRFISYIGAQTPSSTVRAFFDLYLDGVESDLVQHHTDLFAIAMANEGRLGTSPIDWTEFQSKQLIRSQSHMIPIWVRNVCDKQPYEPNADIEDRIYWRKWEAPGFLTMKPFMGGNYDPSAVRKRICCEESLGLLNALADRYVIHFDCWIRDRKGELLVEAAKRPRPAPPNTGPEVSSIGNVSTAANSPARSSAQGYAGPKRKATQAAHARWRTAYIRSKKKRPEMSASWHAQRIAESADGGGASVETIRKNMK
jgi:hypothetical protein